MTTRIKAAASRLADQELPTATAWAAATESTETYEQLLTDILTDAWPGPSHSRLSEGTAHRGSSHRLRYAVTASVVAAVTALALIVVPAIVGSFGTAAEAATPPLLSYAAPLTMETSAAVLQELAAAARRQPPQPGTGRYSYTKIQSWDLSTSQNTSGNVTSAAVVPMIRETWASADGSGREMRTTGGHTTDSQFAPGTPAVYQNLPSDSATLESDLARTHPNYGTYEWFVAVTDVWGVGRPVPPPVQGGLLTLLSSKTDVTVLGTTTDRTGRRGVAISTDTTVVGYPQRNILIFDTSTGALLSYEQVALADGAALPVKAPATVGYLMWLTSAKVNTASTRP